MSEKCFRAHIFHVLELADEPLRQFIGMDVVNECHRIISVGR
jgi:hypothetical protein